MRLLLVLLLLVSSPAAARTITIGQSAFPLDEAAFPISSDCIDASGCPGDVTLADASFQPVSRTDALLGHDLSLVVINMDQTNVFQVLFPHPLVNEVGDDLYLAEAEFTGDPDLEDGIHAVEIRFFGLPDWYAIGVGEFSRDGLAGVPIVSVLDPEPKQAGYFLWFTTQDLTDFGFAPGASITGFEIRGPAGGGLDFAVAGNLNLPEPGTDTLLPAGLFGLAILRAWRQRKVRKSVPRRGVSNSGRSGRLGP